MHSHRLSHGFGLLEVIVVLALLIGASAIVFTVFKSAEANAETSEAVDQVQQVASNLRGLRAMSPGSNADGSVYLLANAPTTAGVAIRQMVFKGMTPVLNTSNPSWPTYQGAWGGSSLILTQATMVPGGNAQNDYWALMYTNVDAASCPRFVMGVAPSVDYMEMYAATAVSGSPNQAVVKPLGGSLDQAAVLGLCAEFEANTTSFGSQHGGGTVILAGR